MTSTVEDTVMTVGEVTALVTIHNHLGGHTTQDIDNNMLLNMVSVLSTHLNNRDLFIVDCLTFIDMKDTLDKYMHPMNAHNSRYVYEKLQPIFNDKTFTPNKPRISRGLKIVERMLDLNGVNNEERAMLYSIQAYLYWFMNETSHASESILHALNEFKDYSLAKILSAILEQNIAPAWVE